ncbi:MAG TPA: DNA-formamidopyrimidine glycosylase family protein [Woeseiaceae bacterium]|nr:DNA-formamidopyrimidine glycosylase family protein [Woeseiaceae bacterium]
MPELPDIKVYVDALRDRIQGHTLERMRINNPFVVRSTSPMPSEVPGLTVTSVDHQAKRIVISLEQDVRIFIHLMIAGRLHWKDRGAPLKGRNQLAALDFDSGSLVLTEAGTKRRASIHLARGAMASAEFDRGGLDPLLITEAQFRERLSKENHTLKRALTDQRLLAGIGNAYSDEILLAARLSPFKQTQALTDDEWQRLYAATRDTLNLWIERLRREAGSGFPKKVTAFREGMAVHGRYRKPCPVCGSPVQRIVYAENEANYCARCQTGERLLADRSLSRLLKDNWPKRLEDLEE